MQEKVSDIFGNAALELALDALVCIDTEGKILEFNPSAERLFGYRRDEILGKRLQDWLIPPRLRESHNQAFGRYLKTGTPPILNLRRFISAQNADGSEFPAEIAITEVQSPRGRYFLGFIRDLTLQKHLESTLFLLTEASLQLGSNPDLPSTLKKLRALFTSSIAETCSIHLLLPDGTFDDPGSAEFLKVLKKKSALSGRKKDGRETLLLPLISRDRPLGLVQLVLPKACSASQPTDLKVIQEIANRVALALENAELFFKARDELRAREDFLAMVSHDMKNPLSAIRMNAELIDYAFSGVEAASAPLARKHASLIKESADLMRGLIHDLLDVTKLEAGYFVLRRRKHDLSKIIREVIGQFKPLAEERVFKLECGSAKTLTWCDEKRIAQVISNLIGNAIKFSPDRTLVRVRIESMPEEIRVSVLDQGPGIAAENLSKVFTRFWQGRDRRKTHSGSGLGLAIAKGIIEAHQGRISVRSGPGKGACFWFTLPRDARKNRSPNPRKSR